MRYRRLPLPLLMVISGCGESWTWKIEADHKETAHDSGVMSHDLDGDGFIDVDAGGDDCWDDPRSIPAAYTAISGSTQPTAAEVNPDAAETWYDGVDQNCAGDDDFDQDADAHRSSAHADGAGSLGDDCYDATGDVYPSGAASCARVVDLTPGEVYPGASDTPYDGTDADCSGNDDFDQDGDGFGRCAECDDTDAAIYPNDDVEVWYDGVDANCDGNDGDQDGDGYYIQGYAFTIPADFEAGDCSDTDASTHPGAADDWYDGVDSNCAGDDDYDADADGYAAAAWGGDDCDDAEVTTYPGATDPWYDGVDSDCAGNDDFDQDGDGFDSTDDCDDTAAGVNPSAVEDCATGSDDDCDGDTNDVGASGCVAFSPDLDGDAYGDLDAAACLCVAEGAYTLAGVATEDSDCDDAEGTVNPGATEVCNDGVDNDCDGGAGACSLSGGSLSTADAEYTGEAAGDYAGWSVAGGGDVNADGYDDLVVGAYKNSGAATSAGAAYLVLGSAAPVGGGLAGELKFAGVGASAGAGYSVSGAGDVNADGYADVVVGAWLADSEGAAYLVLGAASLSSASLSTSVKYSGVGSGDYVGVSVSAAGDVNADGYSDILIGERDVSTYAGAAYLVLGGTSPSSASLATAVKYAGVTADDRAGQATSGAGDVDGDGFDDMLAGAYRRSGSAGAAYLVLGSGTPVSASLSTAVTYTGEASSDMAGASVAGAGDVNADGYADVLVGAYGCASSTGAAYLVLGSASPASASLATAIKFDGEAATDGAGSAVSGLGDIDGDGFDDMVVGSWYRSTYAGAGYVVLGGAAPASTTLSSSVEFAGEAAYDRAGYSVSGAGDVNGDAVPDLVFGAYGNDDGGAEAGAAYLVLGRGL